MKTIFAVAPFCFALAACGGGTTSDGFVNVFEAVVDVDDEILQYSATNLFAIPLSGSAEYNGYAALVEAVDENAVDASFAAAGLASIDFNFNNDTMSGQAYSFYELDAEFENATDLADLNAGAVQGTLTIASNGAVSGTLTKPGGEVANYNLSDAFFGFYGPVAENLTVVAEGTSTASGRSSNLAGIYIETVN